MELGIVSLVPIIVCLSLVLITKNAFVSILSGLLTSSIIFFAVDGTTFLTTNTIIGIATDPYQFKIIGFVMLTGALVNAMKCSGGVEGIIKLLRKGEEKTSSKLLSQLFIMLIGMLMFVDGTSSMVITAVVGKPIFKQLELPKEKLALIVNSTAAPIAWIIPFGGAGAMVAGALAEAGVSSDESFSYVLKAVGFQFYTILLIIILALSIILNKEIGLIKTMKYEEVELDDIVVKEQKAINMLFPIIFLVGSIFAMLLHTGNGNLMKGDGATSIFMAGCLTVFVTTIFYKIQNLANINTILSWFFGGMKNMLEIAILLIIAFSFGSIIKQLGTATYLVQITNFIPTGILPLAILLVSALIAFSTGTSSGTVAIMIPLAIPMIMATGGNISLVIGAIISGAVFGDQNSVISDSVIMTSSVTDVEPIMHVKTQMPYTLLSLSISAILYLILGFM